MALLGGSALAAESTDVVAVRAVQNNYKTALEKLDAAPAARLLPFAFTTESYIYKIVLKEDGRVIEKRGVATSILKKIGSEWKILQTHTSSRALKTK